MSSASSAGVYTTPHVEKKVYVKADFGRSHVPVKFGADYIKKPDDGFFGTVGAGYVINPILRTDITASYRWGYAHSHSFTESETDYSATHEISSVAVMLNGYLTFRGFWKNCPRKWKRISPYLMGGIGYAVNKVDDIVYTSASDATIRVLGDQKRNLVWQIGLGSLFQVTDSIAADLMYRYLDSGNLRTQDVMKMSDGSLSNFQIIKGKLRVHEFSLGINVKF